MENEWILLKISLKFIPKVRISNIPELVEIMAWRRPGDKPLSEPMMVSLLTHVCVTRPQWVKPCKTRDNECVAMMLRDSLWTHLSVIPELIYFDGLSLEYKTDVTFVTAKKFATAVQTFFSTYPQKEWCAYVSDYIHRVLQLTHWNLNRLVVILQILISIKSYLILSKPSDY